MLSATGAEIRAVWTGLRTARGSSLAAVAALALGTGACLAAGVLAYAGLVRPLPLPAPGDLVVVRRQFVPSNLTVGVRLNEFEQWRDRLSDTLALAAHATERITLREGAEPRQVRAAYLLGDWFGVLAARAEDGSLIRADEARDAAVVSRSFADRIAAREAGARAVGRTLVVGGRTLTIAGVLPRSFSVIDDADVWISARGVAAFTPTGQSDLRQYQMIGRVLPGRTLSEAHAGAVRAAAALAPEAQRANWRVEMRTLQEALVGDARPVLLAFFAAAGLLLGTACASAALILVNRSVARVGEQALRLALGASRAALLRVAIAEAVLLGLAGTAAGVWIAWIAMGVIAGQTGLGLPRLATLPSAPTLVAAGVGVGAFVAAVCGAAPLFVLRRASLSLSLRISATRGSRANRRFRAGVVVAQLLMAVVLLTGAGLLGRTLLGARAVDTGLDAPESVITLAVPLGESLQDGAGRLAAVDQMLDRLRQAPGVTAAGLGAARPPADSSMRFTIRVVSENTDASQAFDLVPVTAGYMETLGVRAVEGRLFTDADGMDDPVAVLSESAVQHLARALGSVVGHEINLPLPTAQGTRVKPRIIGVVRDVRYAGLDAPAGGSVYVLWRQLPMPRAFLAARVPNRPEALSADLVRIVRAADPSLPLGLPQTMTAVIGDTLAPRTSRFEVVLVFAVAAAALALVGLSGALARSVQERRRELAIRAAIGATPGDLLRGVMWHGLWLSVAGVGLGLVASAAAARAASAILFGVTPYDALTYGAVAGGVLLVAATACYVPARRAASSDPLELLHAE